MEEDEDEDEEEKEEEEEAAARSLRRLTLGLRRKGGAYTGEGRRYRRYRRYRGYRRYKGYRGYRGGGREEGRKGIEYVVD